MLQRVVIVLSAAWLLLLLAIFEAPHWNNWAPSTLGVILLAWGVPTAFARGVAWMLTGR